jgi:4-carboxymuconolactone decarboxylase
MNLGEQTRREVMGDAFVDKAMDQSNLFTGDMQEYINEHCWGSVWQSNAISRKTRSLLTLSCLVALKAPEELKGHIRGAINNGCTLIEIKEALLHTGVYCGAPALQQAFRAANEVLTEMDLIPKNMTNHDSI